MNYDLIIVGGGSTGAVAAVSAARQGLKTLLIEKMSFLGGTATGGLVTPWMSPKVKNVFVNRGMSEELIDRMHQYGWGGTAAGTNGWFYPEGLKIVLEEMVLEAGAELLYDTVFVDCHKEDRTLRSIKVYNKQGFSELEARYFIDTTGDADLAAAAECPMLSDAGRQATSLRFAMGNVDLETFKKWNNTQSGKTVMSGELVEGYMIWGRGEILEPLFLEAVKKGIINRADGNYVQYFSVPGYKDSIFFNCPEIPLEIDVLNGKEVTRAYIEGHRAIMRLRNFFRSMVPGFEKAEIMQMASQLGVRVSRRIYGEYVITAQDVLKGHSFEDAICQNAYPVDIHHLEEEKIGAMMGGAPEGGYNQVPYRTMVPRDIVNLLVAGRSISAEFTAQSALRVQRVCHNLGEAAGVAVSLASKGNTDVLEVPVSKMQDILRKTGSLI